MTRTIALAVAASLALSLSTRAMAQDASTYDSGAAPAESPNAEKSHDDNLGLEWLWINADVGYSYANMASFNSSNFALQNTASSGPTFGIGAGVRLLSLTLGLRGRDLPLSDFNLVELDGEAAFHTRIGHGDVYFGARGGYAFSGSLTAGTLASATAAGGTPPDVTIHGANAGLMFGFDYYFNHFISIGVDANPESLFLQRPPATLTIPPGVVLTPEQQQQFMQAQQAYQTSGSSIGFAFLGTAHLGVHF